MYKLILMIFVGALLYAQDPGNGKKLYTSIGCYECHGRVGQGGAAGP